MSNIQFRIVVLILSLLIVWNKTTAAHIVDLKMAIDATEIGQPLKVTLDYQLSFVDSILEIPLKAICHRKVSIEKVVINLNGQILEAQFDRTRFPLISASLRIPKTVQRRGTSRLILLYEVRETLVPLLLVDWKPKEAKPKSFQSTVSLPKSYHIYENFPTVPWLHQEKEHFELYSFDLQVIPAWIKWEAQKGAMPILSFYRKIDLFVVITFILTAFFVGRQLKRDTA